MYITYSLTPIIQVNYDGVPFGYTENTGKFYFSFKLDYIGS